MEMQRHAAGVTANVSVTTQGVRCGVIGRRKSSGEQPAWKCRVTWRHAPTALEGIPGGPGTGHVSSDSRSGKRGGCSGGSHGASSDYVTVNGSSASVTGSSESWNAASVTGVSGTDVTWVDFRFGRVSGKSSRSPKASSSVRCTESVKWAASWHCHERRSQEFMLHQVHNPASRR